MVTVAAPTWLTMLSALHHKEDFFNSVNSPLENGKLPDVFFLPTELEE